MSMHLYSNTSEEKFESFGCLFRKLLSDSTASRKITRIWAVSAYYDIESIKQLIAHIKSRISKKPKPELFIVIGTIKHKGLEELKKVKFGNEFKEGSGIRVTNCGRLFHSKGYWVETTRDGMCAIGSMNLTKYGLKEHEEILACSQYKRSKALPPLVKNFKSYVEDWRSDEMSKEIRAVSQGEKGIRWLPENEVWDEKRKEFIYAGKRIRATKRAQNEFVQGNDSNGSLSPGIADKLVQQYFKKLGLRKNQLVDERKFALAFYKLIFEKCRFRPKPYKHGGDTLRSIKPRKNKQHFTERFGYYTHFDVTFASLPNQTYHCKVGLYLGHSFRVGRLTSILNVHVKNEQKKFVNVLQLNVSRQGQKNVREGRFWKICSDGSMGRKGGKGIMHEEVLRAVEDKRCDWIEWSEGKKVVCLGNLFMAEEVTWRNSGKFLMQLLHYAIIRARIKSKILAAQSS